MNQRKDIPQSFILNFRVAGLQLHYYFRTFLLDLTYVLNRMKENYSRRWNVIQAQLWVLNYGWLCYLCTKRKAK